MVTEFGIKVKLDLDKKGERFFKDQIAVQKELTGSYNNLASSMKTVGAGAAAGIGASFLLANKSADGFVGSMLKINTLSSRLSSTLSGNTKNVVAIKNKFGEASNIAKELHETTFSELKSQMAITQELEKQKKKKKEAVTPFKVLSEANKKLLEFMGGGVDLKKNLIPTLNKGGFGKFTDFFTKGLDSMGDSLKGFTKKLLSAKGMALGLLVGLIAIGSFSPFLQSELAFTTVFLEQFSIIVGDGVAPVIGVLNDALKFLLETYQSLSPELKASITTFFTLVTVIAALAVASWALTLPWLALILPIVAVGAALLLLTVAWEHDMLGMKTQGMEFVDQMLEGFGLIGEGLALLSEGKGIEAFQTLWTGLVDVMFAAVLGFPLLVAEMVANALTELGKMTEGIPILSEFFTFAGNLLGNLVSGASDIITGILTLNFDLVTQGWDKVTGKFSEQAGAESTAATNVSGVEALRSDVNYNYTPTGQSNTTIIVNTGGTEGGSEADAEEIAEEIDAQLRARGIIN